MPVTYSAEVLADSPLVYYRLGDASGTTATDSSGNGRNGTYTNTPTLGVAGALAGDSDTAVTFNGTDEYVTIANAAWMNSLSAITLECWYKGSDTAGSLLGRSGNPANYRLGITSSHAFMETNTSSGGSQLIAGTTNIADGNWHHIVGVWTGSNMLIYVDGTQENTMSKTGTLSTTSNSLRVAQRDNDSFAAGTIDEAAVYGTNIGATRITAHYNAGRSLIVAGERWTSAATMLDGTAITSVVVAGERFTSAATMLDGTIVSGIIVAGEAFTSDATMLDGTLFVGIRVAGEAFTSAATMLDGAAQTSIILAGETFVSDADFLDGAVISGVIVISGEAFVSDATMLDGVAVTPITLAGEAFEATAVMLDGFLLTATDTSNLFNGLNLVGLGFVTITRPAVTPPSNVGVKVDKAIPYPQPVMVAGRPT